MPDSEKDEEAGVPEPEAIEAEGPISTRAELAQVEERLAIGANVVYETIRREGDDELSRSPQALAWSGFAAGLSIGFSLVAEALLQAHLPDRPWRPLISRLGYCLGFLIVILGRQQLFTENTLTVILPLLVRRNRKTLLAVLRLWGIVLLTNLLGTAVFGLVLARTNVLAPGLRVVLLSLGLKYLNLPLGTMLWRSVFAGWLVALMVWLLPAAASSRVWIIVIITYVIGLAGFSHVIAGSTTLFYLVFVGAEPWSGLFTAFLLPVLAGNLMGGVALVAALAHGQVVGGGS
ncbi:MAG TPA: formate/nitrite transporter family protein [Terriglobales bacterium]|nr:formate/nitrite transporter family protein [Terriglobales bacterium]